MHGHSTGVSVSIEPDQQSLRAGRTIAVGRVIYLRLTHGVCTRYHGVDSLTQKYIGKAEQMSLTPPDDKTITTLYVGLMGQQISEKDLSDQFYAYGELKGVQIVPQVWYRLRLPTAQQSSACIRLLPAPSTHLTVVLAVQLRLRHLHYSGGGGEGSREAAQQPARARHETATYVGARAEDARPRGRGWRAAACRRNGRYHRLGHAHCFARQRGDWDGAGAGWHRVRILPVLFPWICDSTSFPRITGPRQPMQHGGSGLVGESVDFGAHGCCDCAFACRPLSRSQRCNVAHSIIPRETQHMLLVA
jgi:hypothetical protein